MTSWIATFSWNEPASATMPNPQSPMSNYLTVKQVAEMLAIAPGTVYDMCRDGILPHRRFGCGRGTIRITRSALDHLVAQGAPRLTQQVDPEERDYFASLSVG